MPASKMPVSKVTLIRMQNVYPWSADQKCACQARTLMNRLRAPSSASNSTLTATSWMPPRRPLYTCAGRK